MISRGYLACGCMVSAVGLLGCPDTEGNFDEFQERYETIHPSTGTSATGGGVCTTPPKVGELDGQFLFALLAKPANKSKPVLFDTKLTTAAGAGGVTFKLALQALDAKDRKTPVGAPLESDSYPIAADGSFDAKFPPLTVEGAANPITGSEISAEVEIIGNICAPADFVCGDVEGKVTKPIMLNLHTSTFTMTRLTMAGVYPDPPKIDCQGTLAGPPPK